jgi:hypothetical protein
MNTLKIVSCNEHDHVAVYFNGSLVYQHDIDPEALYRIAEHQEWKVEKEIVSEKEYERRYS